MYICMLCFADIEEDDAVFDMEIEEITCLKCMIKKWYTPTKEE